MFKKIPSDFTLRLTITCARPEFFKQQIFINAVDDRSPTRSSLANRWRPKQRIYCQPCKSRPVPSNENVTLRDLHRDLSPKSRRRNKCCATIFVFRCQLVKITASLLQQLKVWVNPLQIPLTRTFSLGVEWNEPSNSIQRRTLNWSQFKVKYVKKLCTSAKDFAALKSAPVSSTLVVFSFRRVRTGQQE